MSKSAPSSISEKQKQPLDNSLPSHPFSLGFVLIIRIDMSSENKIHQRGYPAPSPAKPSAEPQPSGPYAAPKGSVTETSPANHDVIDWSLADSFDKLCFHPSVHLTAKSRPPIVDNTAEHGGKGEGKK